MFILYIIIFESIVNINKNFKRSVPNLQIISTYFNRIHNYLLTYIVFNTYNFY